MKKRFSEEQIIGLLHEAEASYYSRRSKFGSMSVPDTKRLKELETENMRLKEPLAGQMLENEVIRDVLRKKNRRRTGPTSVGVPHDRQEA